ncbi:tyrosine-type recombinase/integrase (plasmid) [Stenotrophomonas maltophilia]|uniref:tyrosine-type recombinase/integrase n=1 Tax=Stenotrophomonas maltophilia TaxID=40324 RepID=UPI001D0CB4B8|nr:tyrosine-type recombinase/integrase [Stenotrophomonas maltophilia]UXF74616.1 tyrosine-type recombinase/integrase [Stenotrophomonas maltophilia]
MSEGVPGHAVENQGEQLLVVDSLAPGLLLAQGEPVHSDTPAMPGPAAIRQRLSRWEGKYVKGRSVATIKAVRADWGVVTTWCERAGRCVLPMAEADLVLFLTDMLRLKRKKATLVRYVRTIALIHRAAQLPSPQQHPEWQDDWAVICRQLAELDLVAPKQAPPLRTSHVDAMLATLGNTPIELRDAALISLASDTLCRESELVQLQLRDILPAQSGGDFTVYLGRTKTDQDGMGAYRFCSADTHARLMAWCRCAGIEREEDHLFLPVGRRKQFVRPDTGQPMLPVQVARILERVARRAGVGVRFTGHSARVGSAVEMTEGGASVRAIMDAGGWEAERMVLQYTKQSRAGQNAMADLRRKQKRSGE